MSSSSAQTQTLAHPLTQIATSPTHKLLLKQWLKEEDLIARRVAAKESRIDAVRREITALYCSFFVFHSLIILLLLSSSSSAAASSSTCRRSWIPILCSLACSFAFSSAIRYKTDSEAHIERLLEREREDGVLLLKCVDELKRRGVEFDLLKEVDALRRAKSLRVEMKGAEKVRKWSARDFGALAMLGFSVAVAIVTWFVLCNH